MTIEQVQEVVDGFVREARSVPHALRKELQIEVLQRALSSTLPGDANRLRLLAGEVSQYSMLGSELIVAHADDLDRKIHAANALEQKEIVDRLKARRKSAAEKTPVSGEDLARGRRPHREG
jgi:hypothetical protein